MRRKREIFLKLAVVSLSVVSLCIALIFTAHNASAANCAEYRDECVLEAINSLDAEIPTNWTKSGKPRVDALKAATGLADFSAKERDAAWAEFPEWKERYERIKEIEKKLFDAEVGSSELARELQSTINQRDRYRESLTAAQADNRELRDRNVALSRENRIVQRKYNAISGGEKPCASEYDAVKDELNSTWFSRRPVERFVECIDAGD